MPRHDESNGKAEDSELVSGALAGSERAYHWLVVRYQRPVWSIIVPMVRNTQLAEDLTQKVFVEAFRALPSYDHRRKFSSWLFKIAHNATIDHLRKGRLATVPLEDPTSEGSDWLESIEGTRVSSILTRCVSEQSSRRLWRGRSVSSGLPIERS